MDVWSAITDRKSTTTFSSEAPSKDLIEAVLEAFTWAPTHHLNQSWRFDVFTGVGLERLADLDIEVSLSELPEQIDKAAKDKIIDARKTTVLSAPVAIIISVPEYSDGKSRYLEELSAGAAGIQNLLLAAHEKGLASRWRTGKLSRSMKAKLFLGLKENEEIIGIVHLGYAAENKSDSGVDRYRIPVADKITWHDS
ncbi:MAG: nitroreductase [Dehalococcoidia bacterium]|jgi:nitroreductase|nr:nitroreductase [Dehalococcoidia bacterium]|tara:strand:- start:94 stop:681 length:588 start_codon:yes stop_codon:yes gene_type:complete